MHSTLKLQVFVLRKVSDDVGAMFQWCKKAVPQQGWPLPEKGYAHVVAADNEVVVAIARSNGADEARSLAPVVAGALPIASDVERNF
jgi:hypothetical protein